MFVESFIEEFKSFGNAWREIERVGHSNTYLYWKDPVTNEVVVFSFWIGNMSVFYLSKFNKNEGPIIKIAHSRHSPDRELIALVIKAIYQLRESTNA